MKYIFLFVTGFMATQAIAQEVQYFDKLFVSTEAKKTPYERRFTVDAATKTTQYEDHDSGVLSMRGTVRGSVDLNTVNEFIRYARNQGSGFLYKPYFLTLHGEFTFFKKSGDRQLHYFIRDQQVTYAQAWGHNNVPALVSGTGRVKVGYEAGIDTLVMVYSDSLLDESYITRTLEKDTLYYKVDKPAEPKEGMQNFFNNLSKKMRYPVFAQLAGKEGIVYMSFVIDKTGEVAECKPRTPDGSVFEKKALKKLEGLPHWNPAMVKGKPVKVAYTLPVRFKLQ